MVFALGNRVRVATATTGTGTMTLGAALPSYWTFAQAGIANTNTCHYLIEDGTAWEIGLGTYASAGPTLARTTLIASSTGSKLDLSGEAVVMVTWVKETLAAILLTTLLGLDGASSGLDADLLDGVQLAAIAELAELTSTASSLGAALIGVEDSGGKFAGATVEAALAELSRLTLHFMTGLRVTNNASDATNDWDISAGAARDATDAVTMRLAASITKQLDVAWAVGTNAGGLDTGAAGNSLYYAWLILRSDTGVVDVLFSLSATAPTMPTNYDYKRRLRGGFYRSGGVNRPIYWHDDETVHFVTTIEDIDDADIDGEELVVVTCPPSMVVKGRVTMRDTNNGMLITSPEEAAGTPSVSAVPGVTVYMNDTTEDSGIGPVDIKVDSSSQIQATPMAANASYHWVTVGFRDNLWRTGA